MLERDSRWHYDQMMSAIKANVWPPSPEMFSSWLHNIRAEGYRAGYAEALTHVPLSPHPAPADRGRDGGVSDASERLEGALVAISETLDASYAADVSPETVLWRRVTKVSEEAGEVQKALRGLVGENPRKGTTHTMADLCDELMDCAVAALGAYVHVVGEGYVMEPLRHHAEAVAARLTAPVPVAAPDEEGQ